MSAARNNKSIDEDEDSDVELLSISSGDEDSSKPSNNAGKVSGGGGKGGNDDEDKNWTGEEPDRWKRVDEAELTRRVRAMREARVAPAANKSEEKASGVAKKALTSLQSFPRGVECIDPLGIGVVDNKSLRLISDSFASSMPKPEKVDDKLREKLAYFSEKFDAKLFLTRIHQESSAADLEAGVKFLKTDLQGRNDQKRNLVKENFDCFVSCKSTIDDIQTKLKKIEEDPEGAGTAHLFNCIQGVYSLADRSMEPLLERQAQAEKIRSVQGMLQRFRTLFNLPSTIRTSISKGEYDYAVREYRKAKSIALPSHVGILKRVLEEVEKVMQEFKGTLVKSLENPKISLTDLENSVRLLLELEPESDPVWQYLNIQNQRIRGLLERCTLDHETGMEILRNKMTKRDLSDSRWTQVHMSANHSPDGIGGTDVAMDFAGDELDALRGKYIHRLTTVVIHHIPAFWKVTQSVFSGKFAKVTADSNVPASRIEEKVGGKQSSHTVGEVAGMVRSTVSLYESKVLKTFHEFEESNILKAHMSDAIKEVAKACQAPEVKDSAPSAVAASLSAMHSDLSKMYVFGICSWMKTSIEEISRDETWIPVSVMERNRSPYTISYLPLAFRSAIVSAMDQVNVMLQMLKTEVKTEEMLMQFQQIQESVKIAFLNSFLDFCGHLERIGDEVSQNRSRDGSPRLPNGSQESSSDLLPGSIADPNQQLLMVLSNIGYCKDELCNELYDKCKRVWSQSRSGEDGDKRDLLRTFSTLEEKILERYTFAKANWIRKAATNYLLDVGAQWGSAPPVKGVRDAAVELLHTFVAVHAEVYADAKPFLQKTLGILIEGVLDTLLGLFEEHQNSDLRLLDANGYTQLMLELEYFEAVLGSYITSSANGSLASLKSLLLEKAIESATELAPGTAVSPDDLIARAHKCTLEILKVELVRTRINTACFTESIPRR